MDDDKERDEMLISQFGPSEDYKRVSDKLYDYFHKNEVSLSFIVIRSSYNLLTYLKLRKNICLNI